MDIEHSQDGPVIADPRGGVDWERMVAAYGGHLERCVAAVMHRYGSSPRREEVEDVVQEVWQRLIERSRGDSQPWWRWRPVRARAYLGRAAHNAVVDRLRRSRAAKRGGRPCEPRRGDLPTATIEDRADAAHTPEGRLLMREQRAGLWPRLAPLLGGRRAHRDARILVLALVDGFTPEEIAAGLGEALAAGSVYSVLHRARGALARQGRATVIAALAAGDGGGGEPLRGGDLGARALAG
jgi:RNA polymerase sigma factor (sigma-70 family)